MRRRDAISTAAAAGLAIAVALSCSEPPATTQHGARVLVLALDGLDPGVVDLLLADRRLPNLAALVERGSRTTIVSRPPLLSPAIWTTVATGLPRSRHGITNWAVGGRPVASSDRRAPALWNLLPRIDRRMLTVGWLATWPAELEAGDIVSDRANLPGLDRVVAPPGLVDLRRFRRPEVDPARLRDFTDAPWNPSSDDLPESDWRHNLQYLLRERLLVIRERDGFFAGVASHLLRRRRYDLALVYLRGADFVGHGFWKFFRPEGYREAGHDVDPEWVRRLGPIVPRYYEYLDGLVGSLLESAGPEANVVLVSDHGFRSMLRPTLGTWSRFVSGDHRPEGELIVAGPAFARRATANRPLSHDDLFPTLARLVGLPLSDELPGRVVEELLDERFRSAQHRRVAAYPPLEALVHHDVASPADEEILRELRSLGYLQPAGGAGGADGFVP